MPSQSDQEHLSRLDACSASVINSQSEKILIVAGPGAGKTTSFNKLLQNKGFSKERVLVLTFLVNLRNDLEKDLGEKSSVFTFHGYCHHLLRRFGILRGGLTDSFKYFPEIENIIQEDWKVIHADKTPDFLSNFRSNLVNEHSKFYLERGNYYNSIGFDDSVFRVYHSLSKLQSSDLSYNLILVDEFQDFNQLEVDFVRSLSARGPIVIAGDDDQALYQKMRLADPKHIQFLYLDPNYEKLPLPYCTRCTEVIVEATKDFVRKCEEGQILKDRIPRDFDYCPPIKRVDSEQYPFIEFVKTSVQTPRANYFGKYIEHQIRCISDVDIRESREKGFLTALVISSNPFRRQIEDYLNSLNFDIQKNENEFESINRDVVLRNLREDPSSNLWWRLILFFDKPKEWQNIIKSSTSGEALIDLISKDFQNAIMEEVKNISEVESAERVAVSSDLSKPLVKITTFEGAKGLSAAHVFIAGMQNGTLPRDSINPTPIEVKKFLVALTRTRKHCHILYSKTVGGRYSSPSIFLNWIADNRKRNIDVNKQYFENL
ncbi:MAG: UvrD-helicase domain-containing protein [Patescibacteria group bacterium]